MKLNYTEYDVKYPNDILVTIHRNHKKDQHLRLDKTKLDGMNDLEGLTWLIQNWSKDIISGQYDG